ncbi:MAG: nucleoside deaminase [Bryobacterales bacterium]|nr:nucleoside deaminase [Bryobacterales bacterium]
MPRDPYLEAALEQARKSLAEGGIPIGSVLVHENAIVGRGHNCRVQTGSAIDHGEMNCLRNAGRLPARVYRGSVLHDAVALPDVQRRDSALQDPSRGHRRERELPRRRGVPATQRRATDSAAG